MKKLGLVKTLKVGQTFQGIVLSSEAKTYLSFSDKEIVDKYGIACINCSWNRLEEIPFRSMGKNRNQVRIISNNINQSINQSIHRIFLDDINISIHHHSSFYKTI